MEYTVLNPGHIVLGVALLEIRNGFNSAGLFYLYYGYEHCYAMLRDAVQQGLITGTDDKLELTDAGNYALDWFLREAHKALNERRARLGIPLP